MGKRGGVNFKQDFSWQSKFYPSIKKILMDNASKLLKIEVANPEQDMKQATDFMVNVKGGRVAVRIRRNVANSYRDLTIRSKRPNGSETELQKIKSGFADFYLYLWTMNDEIIDWWLVDIGKMRTAGLFEKPKMERWNRDRSSAFIWFTKSEVESAGALAMVK
jgi:hypothetical protein